MSDGPHRSLPLRPRWKQLAESGDKPAFNLTAIQERLEPALLADCQAERAIEVIRQISLIIQGEDLLTLLPEIQITELRALRDGVSVSPLGANVIDCVIMALADGLTGRSALADGIATALQDRAVNNARAIEEHYRHESTARRATNVRSRLESAIATSDCYERIARSIMGERNVIVSRKVPIHSGLDEGVPL